MELKARGVFQGMANKDIEKISRQMREVRHAKGADIMVRGTEGVGFMVIVDGEVEVKTVDGRIHRLIAGDHFGEMALLDDQGRSANVTALTDVVVASIPEWGFKPFLIEHPEVAYRLLETLSRRLREAEEKAAPPAA